MNEIDNINSLISLVESMLSDIEHRNNLESIGDRYADLKDYVTNEIKSLKKASTTEFVETIYIPALDEFILTLKPPKGTSDPGKLYDPLLDGVGYLKYYADQVNET